MRRSVVVNERAIADLAALTHWIADRSDLNTALASVDRIQDKFDALCDFPHRGTPRDHLTAGARSLIFERRQLIVYRVDAELVRILRVVDGARDLRELAI